MNANVLPGIPHQRVILDHLRRCAQSTVPTLVLLFHVDTVPEANVRVQICDPGAVSTASLRGAPSG